MRVQAMIAASEGTLELEQGASPSRGPSALTIQNDTARALNSAVTVTESPGRRLTLNLLKPSYFSRSCEHGWPRVRRNAIVNSVTRSDPALLMFSSKISGRMEGYGCRTSDHLSLPISTETNLSGADGTGGSAEFGAGSRGGVIKCAMDSVSHSIKYVKSLARSPISAGRRSPVEGTGVTSTLCAARKRFSVARSTAKLTFWGTSPIASMALKTSNLAATTPITFPLLSSNGPPLLPCWIGVVI